MYRPGQRGWRIHKQSFISVYNLSYLWSGDFDDVHYTPLFTSATLHAIAINKIRGRLQSGIEKNLICSHASLVQAARTHARQVRVTASTPTWRYFHVSQYGVDVTFTHDLARGQHITLDEVLCAISCHFLSFLVIRSCTVVFLSQRLISHYIHASSLHFYPFSINWR